MPRRIGVHSSHAQPAGGERLAVLQLLFDLRPADEALQALDTFVEEGWAAAYIGQEKEAGADAAEWIAMCLHAYLQTVPNLAPQRARLPASAIGFGRLDAWRKQLPDTIATALARRLLDSDDLELLSMAREASADMDGFISAVLSELVAMPRSSSYFTAARIVDDRAFLLPQLGATLLVERAGGGTALFDLIRVTPFEAESADLYAASLSDTPSSTFAEWCADGLRHISSVDIWTGAIEDKNYVIDLVHALLAQEVQINLGEGLAAALRHRATVLAGGGVVGASDHADRDALFHAMEPSRRQTLREELYEKLIDTKSSAPEAFFDFVGDELIASNLLNAAGDAYTRLLGPLIDSRHLPSWNWLVKCQQAGPSPLSGLSTRHRKAFTERLAAALRDGPHDAAQLQLEAFASLVGIDPASDTKNAG